MGRPKQKHYEKSALQAAVREVSRGKCLSKVAKAFGIPRSTLYDHTRGHLQGNFRNPGIDPSLSNSEEESLIKYMQYMADRGQPLTTSIMKRFVVAIVKKSGRASRIKLEKGPSKKWCRKFFKRHPELKRRRPDRADHGRLSVTLEQVEHYFDLLGSTLEKLDLCSKPDQIFNCDETGFDGRENGKERVVVVGKQHPYQQHLSTNIGHITMQLAISASGKFIPPMLIFSKSLPRDMDQLPHSWKAVSSKKGYIDSDLFVEWLEDVFVPHCGRNRPVLLIMDNLGAHLTPRAIDVARANNIELLCLPAHSTHLLQPLDVRVFNIVKSNLAKAAARVGFQCSRISRANMPSLIKYALNSLSGLDIIDAFRLTGIMPFNPSVVSQMKQSLFRENEQEINTSQQLVDMGIVPAELADIFIPPPPKQKKTSRKITGARVITQQEPQPSTSGAASSPSLPDQESSPITPVIVEEHPDDGICVVCMTNARLEWIGCDKCPNWFHYQCLSRRHQTLVDLSIVTGDGWFCGFCDEE